MSSRNSLSFLLIYGIFTEYFLIFYTISYWE